jgi:hypothetical protein
MEGDVPKPHARDTVEAASRLNGAIELQRHGGLRIHHAMVHARGARRLTRINSSPSSPDMPVEPRMQTIDVQDPHVLSIDLNPMAAVARNASHRRQRTQPAQLT